MKVAKFVFAWLFIACCGDAAASAQDLSSFFKGTKGAFVLYDLKNNHYVRYNEQRCRERFSPKSTFKVPNSLIGLESGVIRDAEFVIPWNREKYPPQADWNQEPFIHWGKDQTLRSALKHSVLWYYRELALRAGEQQMKKYVTAFDYGNKDITGRVDNFWLNNTLKISADEQVEFLKAFYTGRLPVSKRSIQIVKDILVFEQAPAYKLSAKTGGGPIAEGIYIGWFVGYLETKGNVYFFATNIEGASFLGIRDRRIELTKQILTALGHLPTGGNVSSNEAVGADKLRIEKTDRVGRKIENQYFIADLSHRTIQDKEEDSGTLRALTYKQFGVTLLRTRNRMHWAPNLQRVGAQSYRGIGTWHPVQEFREEQQDETYIHRRAGYLAEYPEVKIEAEYRFLPGVPYFLFSSRMTVEKPLAVTLLRNNEMTMDQFFTHLAWPGRDGRQHLTTFDERKPLLEKEPIAVDAPWLVFLNLDKGYGYGFVMLDYQATRSANPGTGISDGEGNGKYWSRYIVVRAPTQLEPGDRFEERTAYVLFRCTKEEPLREFFEWEKQIRNKFGKGGK